MRQKYLLKQFRTQSSHAATPVNEDKGEKNQED